jgi:hypothetical protein
MLKLISWGVCPGLSQCGRLGVLVDSESGCACHDLRCGHHGPFWLCADCDEEHQAYWEEMWSECHASQGIG